MDPCTSNAAFHGMESKKKDPEYRVISVETFILFFDASTLCFLPI